MIRKRAIRTREKLVSKLPISGELLRGTLLERIGVAATASQPVDAEEDDAQVLARIVASGVDAVERSFSI